MEVAERWRQQWAGAAEYGKTVDGVGGVTRMARALEVMQASGPGARVRVTRTAFHSAGPLSSSYVFHSSKRTILSSRSNGLSSPSLVWKPQEVSSTPLDAASDSCPEGEEPYKVTEPDDSDISEPSKWRPSVGRSIPTPISEESSSADNASLIDSVSRVAHAGRTTDSSKASSTSSQNTTKEEPKSFRSSFRRKPNTEVLMNNTDYSKASSTTSKTTTQDEPKSFRSSFRRKPNTEVLTNTSDYSKASSTTSETTTQDEPKSFRTSFHRKFNIEALMNATDNSTCSSNTTKEEPKAFRSSFRRKPNSEPLMKIAEHAKCLESTKTKTSKCKDEWLDRRNSYGFESPLNGMKYLTEINNGMESSTDSGIHKSSEIVSIPIKVQQSKDLNDDSDNSADNSPKSFRDWLNKNRTSPSYNTDFSFYGRNASEANVVNLKSLGKISIALPKSSDRDSSEDDHRTNHNKIEENYESSDRKSKKVGFSKTELHFAAESGIVNIIETDEKPPPKQDFRRRRSAFVRVRNEIERPITLLGSTFSTNDDSGSIITEETHFGGIKMAKNTPQQHRANIENDNESTVKSILKNKIPKPIPYLLGEDGELDTEKDIMDNIWGVRLRRTSDEYLNNDITKSPISNLNESHRYEKRILNVPTQNRDKIQDRIQDQGKFSKNSADGDFTKSLRDHQSSPIDYVNVIDIHENNRPRRSVASTQTEDFVYEAIKSSNKQYDIRTDNEDTKYNDSNNVNEKLKLLQLSPIMKNKTKTRNLRQNELSYFGITSNTFDQDKSKITSQEADTITGSNKPRYNKKYEQPLYQNIPLQPLPVPAPRSLSNKDSQNNTKKKTPTNEEKNERFDTIMDTSDFNKSDSPSRIKTEEKILKITNKSNISARQATKKSSKQKASKIDSDCKRNASPIYIKVETPSRISSKKISIEKPSMQLANCRENSLGVSERTLFTKTTRQQSKPGSDTNEKQSDKDIEYSRLSDKLKSPVELYTELLQMQDREPKFTSPESMRKKRSRSSSLDSRDKSLHHHHSDTTRSRSHSRKESSRLHTPAREVQSTIAEEQTPKAQVKRKGSPDSRQKGVAEKLREKSKKDYVLNYNEKNGTLSSVTKAKSGHNTHRKQEKSEKHVEKRESRPKEVTRTSKVTTLELKNPTIITKESHRNKSTNHRNLSRKHKEEPPQ